MSVLSILSGKQKTLVADGTITGMTGVDALIQVTCAAHGLETGDIVQISGVAAPADAANGQWVVTKVSSSVYSLNNSLGSGTWGSGGTVKHIGFASAAVLVDNTVFTASTSTDVTLMARIEEISSGANIRVVFEDAGASTFIDAQPLATFVAPGALGAAGVGVYAGLAGQNDKTYSAKKADMPDIRLGASGDNVRVKMFISGGAGKTAQLTAALTY
jgi:hypothetical protein